MHPQINTIERSNDYFDDRVTETQVLTSTEVLSEVTNIINFNLNEGFFYPMVYTNIRTIHFCLIIQHIINNSTINQDATYQSQKSLKRHLINLKKLKYKQLLRMKYSEYIQKFSKVDISQEE